MNVFRAVVAAAAVLLALGPAAGAGAAPAEAPASQTDSQSQFAAAVSDLENLPGQVGLLVVRDGQTLAAHKDATPLAVASASQLAILAALKKAYAAGTLKPQTVVSLQAADKAPFGGVMRDWPADTPLTVATAAALMAGIGDYTAADLLMRVLGRDAVDAAAPPRDRPYLNPRELLVLKAAGNAALAAAWKSAATPAARAHVLAEADAKPTPGRDAFGPGPQEPQVEWFYTSRELCALMDEVADMPETGIGSGIAPKGWKRVAFASGSEPGVLDMTYGLEAGDGVRYCVTATWNADKELGNYKLTALMARLIGSLPH